MKKRYILVGAKPQQEEAQNPGGQLTASRGLVLFASQNDIDLEIIDITQNSFPVPSVAKRIPQAGKRILLLAGKVRRKDIDGVIIFSNNMLSFIERICMSVVCRLFGVKDLFFNRSGLFMMQIERAGSFKKLIPLLLRLPYRIAVQGQVWIDYYATLGIDSQKIVCIPNWVPPGIDIARTPRSVIDRTRVRFIFVAWLNREKGVEEILDAIDKLRPEYSFGFTFVGSGNMEEVVRATIKIKKWGQDITLAGWQQPEAVQTFLDAADVFVLPSYVEGFPNALLEAMAKGLPVVCSDVGCIPDSVVDGVNGFLVSPGDATGLKQAMEKYLRNPNLIETHSGATLEVVKNRHDFIRNCRKIFDSLSHRFSAG